MGKRLFIAVDIDEVTRGQLDRISSALRERVETVTKASWVRPDRMHLTLLFCGSADAVLEERIRGALAQPIRESPFDLTFRGLGCFPERGSPRVLWLGIRDGLAELRRIQKTLEYESGAPPEREGPLDLARDRPLDAARDRPLDVARDRPFTPHLTLARFKDRVPRAKIAEIADIPASAGPSRIDRVTLYESRLSPAGPTYLPLAEALLSS